MFWRHWGQSSCIKLTITSTYHCYLSLTLPLLPFITFTCCNLPPFTLKSCSMTNVASSALADLPVVPWSLPDCSIAALFHQLLPYARVYFIIILWTRIYSNFTAHLRFHKNLSNDVGYGSPKFISSFHFAFYQTDHLQQRSQIYTVFISFRS